MGVINITNQRSVNYQNIGAIQQAQAGDRSAQWKGLANLGSGLSDLGQVGAHIYTREQEKEDQRLSNEAFNELSRVQMEYDYNTEKNEDGKVGTFCRKGSDLKSALEDSNAHLREKFKQIADARDLSSRARRMFEQKFQALALSNQHQIKQYSFKQGKQDLVDSFAEAIDATDRAVQQAPDNGMLYDQAFAQNEGMLQAMGVRSDTVTERKDENGGVVKVTGAEYELKKRAFMDTMYTKAITREIDAVKDAKDMDAIIKRLGDPEAIDAYLKEDSAAIGDDGKPVARLGNAMRDYKPTSKINNALVDYARTHKRKLQNEAWGKEREEYRAAYATRGQYEIKAWKAADNIVEIQRVRDELSQDTSIPESQEKQRVAGLQYCDRLIAAKKRKEMLTQKANWDANPQNPKNVYASARAVRFNSSQALEPLMRRKNALALEAMRGGYDEMEHQKKREQLWNDFCAQQDKGVFTAADELKFLNGWQGENDEATREALMYIEEQFPHDKDSPASGKDAKRTITGMDGNTKTISEYDYDHLVQKLKIRLMNLPAEADRSAIARDYVSQLRRDYLKDGFVGVSKHMSQYFVGGGLSNPIMLQSTVSRSGQDARVRMGQAIDAEILALQAQMDAQDSGSLGVEGIDDSPEYYDDPNQSEQE